MIHLDTNILIDIVTAHSPQVPLVREWLSEGRVLTASAVAWSEFLNGPHSHAQKDAVRAVLAGGIDHHHLHGLLLDDQGVEEVGYVLLLVHDIEDYAHHHRKRSSILADGYDDFAPLPRQDNHLYRTSSTLSLMASMTRGSSFQAPRFKSSTSLPTLALCTRSGISHWLCIASALMAAEK